MIDRRRMLVSCGVEKPLIDVINTNSYPEWLTAAEGDKPLDWVLLNAVAEVYIGELRYKQNFNSIGQLIWLDTEIPVGSSYRITIEVMGTIGEVFRVAVGGAFLSENIINITSSGYVKYIIEGISTTNSRVNFQRRNNGDTDYIYVKYLAVQEM